MTNQNDDNRARAAGEALARLVEVVARLRAPDGCPWDREQTVASSASYLLEEACEAVEALERQGQDERREELGDVLFQVVFQAQLAAEAGGFDLAEVIEAVRAKMVHRHPHVFGEAKVDGSAEVLENWGRIKAREKAANGGPQGLLDTVPATLPALARAHRLGQRAARARFDWDSPKAVWIKVDEELGELREAAGNAADEADELGDALFALAQWARHKGLNAEQALREANARFVRRFRAMEELAQAQGRLLEEMTFEQREALWERVKAHGGA